MIIRERYLDIFLLIIIIGVGLMARVWLLDKIPPNITGDEVTCLSDVYKILYSPHKTSAFSLMGDGTQSMLTFYIMALFTKIVGVDKSFLAVRFSIAALSTLALVPFYFLVKKKTSHLVAFIFSILVASNYWYLNISRNGWINGSTLFFGLIMLAFLEKGVETNKHLWFALAGMFASFCLYGYLGSVVFVLVGILILVTRCLSQKDKRMVVKNMLVFTLTTAILFLPQLLVILKNPTRFFLRPKTVFVLSAPRPYYGHEEDGEIILYQIKDTIKGLVFLDGSVIGKGVENQRYTPVGKSVVDPVIRVLFLLGLVLALLQRWKILPWWLLFSLTLILVVVPTIDAPNTARALPVLPVIYFVAAFATYRLIQVFQKIFPIRRKLLCALLLFASFTLVAYNISHYFLWAQTSQNTRARQPAIEYGEFSEWQEFQIERVKNGQLPINNYEWYKIRDSND